MNEFELIARLTPGLPRNDSVVVGAGDDCAVLDLKISDRYALFKTDAIVEGVHFTADTPAEKVGHKALGRCLSDIAAMAGTPTAALITIGLPQGFDAERVERIYAGLNALARRHDVAIVGGETTTNPERIWISISVLGWVAMSRCILRSGAKPGDAIFVTGELGGSIAGRHLDFEPRLSEARWLAGKFSIHAMIDLSDGLAGDLRHVLTASDVGAALLASAIPISRAAKLAYKNGHSKRPPLLAALTDGEDFELLFTLPGSNAVALMDAWKLQFPETPLHCVGKITEDRTVTISDRDGVKPLPKSGYVHFGESAI